MLMGIILALDHSKFMQKDDVLDIYEIVHGHYYDHLELFLVLLGLGIAIFGYIIPKKNKEELEKFENRLKETNDRNEIRLDEQIHQIRIENQRFQDSINERIEERLSDKMLEYNKVIDDLTKKIIKFVEMNFTKLDKVHHAHREFIYAIISIQNNQPDKALTCFLISALKAVQSEQYIILNDINNNLKDNPDFFSSIDKNKVKPRESLTALEYLNEIENNLGSDENNNKIFYNFKELITKIINK